MLSDPRMAAACLRIVGHSDTYGSSDANYRLAERRAQAVAAALSEANPGWSTRIEVASAGEAEPLEGIAGGDRRNRRVELWARTCR